jgi:hypothetical protein
VLRRAVTRLTVCTTISFAYLGMALETTSARATEYVDGISDQSMASWDGGFGGYFTSFFKSEWIASGHIKYARFVMPWYESGSGTDAEYKNWCADAGGMGLTLDLSLTSYRGTEKRPTLAEYKVALKAFLEQCPAVKIVEPWNEPNNGGENAKGEATVTYVNPTKAGEYAKETASLCNTYGCTTVVGNLLDSDSNMVEYEEKYVKAMAGWTFPDWGMHPYTTVKEESTAKISGFEAHWGDGASSLWFTEVGAYNCLDFGTVEVPGEASEGEHAKWLVRTLIPTFHPAHVFYYEFLDGDGHQPQAECEGNKDRPDTALYVPSSDLNAPDRPRPAAAWIFDNAGSPWAYTGLASSVETPKATLTGSVYPGGKLEAKYHFEYGTTSSYGQYSAPEGDAGTAPLGVAVAAPIEYLAAGTTYHYRLVAWNSEGVPSYGAEQTFRTQPAPEVKLAAASGVTQEQAILNGSVNPEGLATSYYFQYGTTTNWDEGETSPVEIGNGITALPESVSIKGLLPGTTYYDRIVATSSAGTSYSSPEVFSTVARARAGLAREASASEQWVYYRAVNGGILGRFFNPAPPAAWETFSAGSGEGAAPGTSPAVVL